MWNQKEYLASEIFDLTDEEKREVNQKMINKLNTSFAISPSYNFL